MYRSRWFFAQEVCFLLLLLGPVLAASAMDQSGCPRFTGQPISVGEPVDAVSLDFDGDGVPDLAVAGADAGVITVLLSTSGFIAQEYGGWISPDSIIAADLNGDGYPDIATADGRDGSVIVLLNRGDGSFDAGNTYNGGSGPQGISVGDLDEDGYPELVVANLPLDRVTVLHNDGHGAFPRRTWYMVPTMPVATVVADFDGDGHADVVVTSRTAQSFSFLRNQGDGTLAPRITTPTPGEPERIAVGDVDGDHALDMVMQVAPLQGQPQLLVLHNDGHGGFTTAAAWATPGGRPTLADVRRVGALDILLPVGDAVLIYANDGHGSFGAPLSVPAPISGVVLAGDYNSDGLCDIAIVDGVTWSVDFLWNTGSNTFVRDALAAYPAGADPIGLAAAPLTPDGRPDVLTFNQGSQDVTVLRNPGDGTLLPPVSHALTGPPIDGLLCDLNGDGSPELVAVAGPNHIDVLLNRGDGTFAPAIYYAFASRVWAARIAELNGDGHPDVAVLLEGDNYGQVATLLNDGHGSFSPGPTTWVEKYTHFLAAGDLNRDGAADLVCASWIVQVLLNRGDGSFDHASSFEFSSTGLTLGDLSGSGVPDLILIDGMHSTLNLWHYAGAGVFQPYCTWGARYAPTSLRVLDLNGDGRLDLAWIASQRTAIEAVLNLGEGTFGNRVIVEPGPACTGFAFVDLDQNGQLDVVSAHQTDEVRVMRDSPSEVFVVTAPASQIGIQGRATTLSGHATGRGPLAYQWRMNGVPLVDNGHISGARTPDVQIDPVAPSDAGRYDVVVSGHCGSTVSASAALRVFAPGDVNCDGRLDFSDINPFVVALANPAGYAGAFPDCDLRLADINNDGRVSFEDINPFVELLAR